MATLEELEAQRTVVTKQIEAIRRESREQAILEIRRLLNQHGLSASDVASASTKNSGAAKVGGRKVAPKYRDPVTGQTWSGRGLKPKWMVEAIAAGRHADSFLI
jgi:DNA-binding protein H-NS